MYYYFDDLRDDSFYKKRELHENIVKNIAKVINELSLNNVHENFYAFCYLLWKGYFSIDKIYEYSDELPLDENNTIFLGEGCCRHNSNLLNEVFKNMEIYTNIFPLSVISSKLKKVMDIEVQVKHYTKTKTSKEIHNHQVCVGPFFEKDKSIFIFDPTKLTECEIIRDCKMISFNGKYKINNDLFKHDLNYGYLCRYKYNKKVSLNIKKIKEFYDIARETCEKNINLFDDFYEENKINYEEIKTLILKKDL